MKPELGSEQCFNRGANDLYPFLPGPLVFICQRLASRCNKDIAGRSELHEAITGLLAVGIGGLREAGAGDGWARHRISLALPYGD